MPKLKRAGDADNRGATDFIESFDRGLRVLEVFGGSRDLQRTVIRRVDRSHHRSEGLGRAADRAAGRHTAA